MSSVSPTLFRTVWLVVISICLVGCFVVYQKYQFYSRGLESEDIFVTTPTDQDFSQLSTVEASPEKRGRGLKPNLQQVKMIVPDRPHNPNEIIDAEEKRRFLRRREFVITTDNWGFRTSVISMKKKEEDSKNKNRPRVLVLGDSKTFGWGVEYYQSYVYYLEKALPIEVINASMPGSVPMDAALEVERLVQNFSPSIVLFHFRPEYDTDDSIHRFLESIHHLQMKLGNAQLVLVLPPMSTFETVFDNIERYYQSDNIGVLEQRELQQKLPNITVIDTTSTFRTRQKQMVSQSDTLVLFSQKDGTQYLSTTTGKILIQTDAPTESWFSFLSFSPPTVFSTQIVQAFESNTKMREPLFLDGAHLDAEGSRLFAEIVAQSIRSKIPK